MKLKLITLLLIIVTSLSSCVYNDYDYDCYAFEIRKEVVYVPDHTSLPYIPPTISYQNYSLCGISSTTAFYEAEKNEYVYSYYYNGYYVTETQTCIYWYVY